MPESMLKPINPFLAAMAEMQLKNFTEAVNNFENLC